MVQGQEYYDLNKAQRKEAIKKLRVPYKEAIVRIERAAPTPSVSANKVNVLMEKIQQHPTASVLFTKPGGSGNNPRPRNKRGPFA